MTKSQKIMNETDQTKGHVDGAQLGLINDKEGDGELEVGHERRGEKLLAWTLT